MTARYDADLQMFTDDAHTCDLEHLRYMRWLSERGILEHTPMGPPCGEYALMDAQLAATAE